MNALSIAALVWEPIFWWALSSAHWLCPYGLSFVPSPVDTSSNALSHKKTMVGQSHSLFMGFGFVHFASDHVSLRPRFYGSHLGSTVGYLSIRCPVLTSDL